MCIGCVFRLYTSSCFLFVYLHMLLFVLHVHVCIPSLSLSTLSIPMNFTNLNAQPTIHNPQSTIHNRQSKTQNPQQTTHNPQPLRAVANKHDMRHLAVVKPEQHNCFAEENGLNSFLMSAKNGDQVSATFMKIGVSIDMFLRSYSVALLVCAYSS